MKRFVCLPVCLTFLMSLWPPGASAWSGTSHETLAREAVNYMLRSGHPELRLVGAILVGAGEGYSAGPGVRFRHPLAEEAKYVDGYREVAAHNAGSVGLGDLMPSVAYSIDAGILGASFAAFNHFLLPDRSFEGQHDNYPGQYMREDESLQANGLGQLLIYATTDELQQECARRVQEYVDNELGYLHVLINLVFLPIVGNAILQSAGSFAESLCPKLVLDFDHSPVMTDGLYRRNHSTAVRADFEGKPLADIIWHPVDNLAAAGTEMFLQGGHGRWLDNVYMAETIIPAGGMFGCPDNLAVMGSYCIENRCSSTALEPTWSRYCNFSCTDRDTQEITRFSFHDDLTADRMVDEEVLRFLGQSCQAGVEHACEFLSGAEAASADAVYLTIHGMTLDGPGIFCAPSSGVMNCHLPDEFRMQPAVPAACAREVAGSEGENEEIGLAPRCFDYFLGLFGSMRVPAGEWPAECRPSNLTPAGESCLDELWRLAELTGRLDSRSGQLLHLGRLLHGLADVAQPGHVTNHLLGREHTTMEDFTEGLAEAVLLQLRDVRTNVEDGADFANEYGDSPYHVVVIPEYAVGMSGEQITADYDLDLLMDVEVVEEMIGKYLYDPFNFIHPDMSFEDLVENVAWETLRMIQEYDRDGAHFLSEGEAGSWEGATHRADEVSRAFFGHAFVAEIAGLHRAVREYLGEETWDAALSRVSWTGSDLTILRELGVTPPFLSLERAYARDSLMSAFVDAAYQSKAFMDTCHVRIHNWCSADTALGRPCGTMPDCVDLGCDPSQPESCANELCAFRVTRSIDGGIGGLNLFYDVPIEVRVSPANHSRLPSDQFQITGTFAEGTMDVAYYRQPVDESAGMRVFLPPEIRSVATWCNGSNVFEEDNIELDENGERITVPSLVCMADIGLQEGHEGNECDPVERDLKWGTHEVVPLDGLVWEEMDPLDLQELLGNPLVNVVDIASRYDASPVELAKALDGSQERTVEVVTDSQFAAVTFSWVLGNEKVIVAIDESGTISRTTLIVRTR